MIRVLILDEVRAVGETLSAVLQAEKDLDVIGCATNLNESLRHLERADVALVNSQANGAAAARLVGTLRQLAARARIVVMGLEHGHHDWLACLDAGATICLTKDSPLHDLINRLRAPYGAATAPSASTEATLPAYRTDWGGYALGGDGDDATVNLTRREREVITLVRLGFTNQDIAEALVIELGTVKNHVHNILRKLNVNSRREAVQVSRLAGLWGPHEARPKDEAPYHAPEASRYAMTAAANV